MRWERGVVFVQGFADIHTHILPGVDDGAQTGSEAIALLAYAYDQGTRTVFLTSHYRGDYRRVTPEQRRKIFDALCAAAKLRYPDLALHLGCEIAYAPGIGEKLQHGEILSYANGDYVLLEFADDAEPDTVLQGVDEVLRSGFLPVIAHAERCAAFRKGISLARQVTDKGALLQLNADSVMGQWGGFWVERCCQRLLKAGLVSFIASDAHDVVSRPPDLGACYHRVAQTYGKEYAAQLFWENARLLLPEE